MPSWQVAASSLKKKTISHRPTQTDTDEILHRRERKEDLNCNHEVHEEHEVKIA